MAQRDIPARLVFLFLRDGFGICEADALKDFLTGDSL
jgi:hypothetical protein